MNRFDFIRPASVAEAVAAASEPGSAYLAAGTNLLDLMKIGVARPGRLVDITRLDLGGIEETADVLGVSPRTVNVDWQMARAWLRRELCGSPES